MCTERMRESLAVRFHLDEVMFGEVMVVVMEAEDPGWLMASLG